MSSPYLSDYAHYAWQLLNGFRASHEQEMARLRQSDIIRELPASQSLRILDLANGRLRPQYSILKASGHHVYGIDIANRPGLSWIDVAYRGARWLHNRKLGLPSG